MNEEIYRSLLGNDLRQGLFQRTNFKHIFDSTLGLFQAALSEGDLFLAERYSSILLNYLEAVQARSDIREREFQYPPFPRRPGDVEYVDRIFRMYLERKPLD